MYQIKYHKKWTILYQEKKTVGIEKLLVVDANLYIKSWSENLLTIYFILKLTEFLIKYTIKVYLQESLFNQFIS